MNIYVQRMNYDTAYDFVKSEILEGRLRQGWGIEGADLNGGPEKFIEAWRAAGAEEPDEWLARKYRNLCIIQEMKAGDIIVVPKLSMNTPCGDWEAWDTTFTVLEVTEEYRFEPVAVPEWDGDKDFGNIIGVKVIGSCSYYQSDLANIISATFGNYRSPENRVHSRVISEAVKAVVEELIAIHDEDSAETDELTLIQRSVEKCTPEQLRPLVNQLFLEGGFAAKNLDEMTFSLMPSSSLIGDIALAVCGKFSAVRVYTHESEWQEDAVNILVDVAGTFSDEALQDARSRDITLLRLSAREFAELLMKYRVILPE